VKIAIICRPWSFRGGVETATAGLIGELVRQGESIDLVTVRGQPPIPGVRLRIVPTLPGPSLGRLLSFALGASRIARRTAYDVVQSHERVLRQDVYRAGEGTHRGYLAAMERHGRGPYHRTLLWLEGRIFGLQAARHVVAISRPGQQEIEALYGTPRSRLSLVYNGVDLSRFHPDRVAALRRSARAELELTRDAWVILFVGSGFERKGLAPLVGAFARFGDRRARLIVVGKGETARVHGEARRLGVGDRLLWLGARPDVERLYAAADVVALPSRYEPFGNVVLEALASGVPVLTSRHVGASDVIRSGENGWVAERVEPAAILAGLSVLRDADPVRLGAAARCAAEPFTYPTQVAALREVYRSL
jgi:UDP-glucose:(heptosyl)LPS alpha-1,3-glucosyltransferase